MFFVIAFDRKSGARRGFEAFESADRGAAESVYRAFLNNFISDASVEVNIFESDSEDTFARTHERYFKRPVQIDADLIEYLRSVKQI